MRVCSKDVRWDHTSYTPRQQAVKSKTDCKARAIFSRPESFPSGAVFDPLRVEVLSTLTTNTGVSFHHWMAYLTTRCVIQSIACRWCNYHSESVLFAADQCCVVQMFYSLYRTDYLSTCAISELIELSYRPLRNAAFMPEKTWKIK